MKETNIKRVLDLGIALMCQKGYNDLGLRELLEAAQVPKGSFYYYFQSKEDFGLKAVEYYAKKTEDYFRSILLDSSKSAKDRLLRAFNEETERILASDFKEGCILGDLSNEVANQMDAMQILIESKYLEWQAVVAQFIREGQKSGEFMTEPDPDEMANLFLNNRQGALTRVKASRSIAPYKLFKDLTMRLLLK